MLLQRVEGLCVCLYTQGWFRVGLILHQCSHWNGMTPGIDVWADEIPQPEGSDSLNWGTTRDHPEQLWKASGASYIKPREGKKF